MRLRQRIGLLGAAAMLAAVGTAAPATAEPSVAPPPDGKYSYNQPGKPAAQWSMQSICSQASGTRAQPDYSDPHIQTLGCVLNVTSTTDKPADAEQRLLNVAGRARLTNGLWAFEYNPPAGQICPDGRTARLQQKFEFSEVTLTGTRTTLWGDECGGPPGMTKEPFSLSFLAPLDPPVVDRFPMECNYLAGRPSICS